VDYAELSTIESFEDRLTYLTISKKVGEETFGFERFLNQTFYKSREWQDARRSAIARDYGNDLGVDGHPIFGNIIVHHINPLSPIDVNDRSLNLIDLNNLISCSLDTHNAIHYGGRVAKIHQNVTRTPGDQILW
jgi:hypothetical protein